MVKGKLVITDKEAMVKEKQFITVKAGMVKV